VYAKDGDQLYKAKIVKVTSGDGKKETSYFIHYIGWNNRWDKWVSEELLLPDNNETKALQKKMKQESKEKQKNGDKRKEGGKSKQDGMKDKKRAKINEKEHTEDISKLPQIKIPIPFTLKRQLVDDWEWITHDPGRLAPIPRAITVEAIMQQFMEFKQRRGNSPQLQRYQEMVDGIRIYFDKALPVILLYLQEREQYNLVKAKFPDKPPSQVYGAEHLLRLFVRLPTLLAQTDLSPPEVSQVQTKLSEFLKFLQKNHENFFLHEYEIAEKAKDLESTLYGATSEKIKDKDAGQGGAVDLKKASSESNPSTAEEPAPNASEEVAA